MRSGTRKVGGELPLMLELLADGADVDEQDQHGALLAIARAVSPLTPTLPSALKQINLGTEEMINPV